MYAEIEEENKKRLSRFTAPYDPVTGKGAYGRRKKLCLSDFHIPIQYIPLSMFENPTIQKLADEKSIESFCNKYLSPYEIENEIQAMKKYIIQERINHDFEFWAIIFVLITPKMGGEKIPFRLNFPQRSILLPALEKMRLANLPIRIILLKARQWGGSTLVQIYMAWIQLVHKKNWNSVICAHLRTSSQNIKGMFSNIIQQYPPWLVGASQTLEFSPYEHSQSTFYIKEREIKVVIGSSQTPDSVRGENISMAHCSEVAFYVSTPNNTPEQLIRSVCGGILPLPYTVIVYESTANGTGDFFHKEWLRAKKKASDKVPVFVAWFDVEIYQKEVEDYKELIDSFTEYDWFLWKKGATLEAISFYKSKSKEYDSPSDMKAEYPSDDIEAFKHSGREVFDKYKLSLLRNNCMDPSFKGEIVANAIDSVDNVRFVSDPTGCLSIWEMPDKTEQVSDRYLTILDTSVGVSDKADWAVVTTFDRYALKDNGKMEVVAEWRGHIDMDMVAWKAAQISAFYNNALLVIESNSYETHNREDVSEYILDKIAYIYDNLYFRTVDTTAINGGESRKWGFHTNTKTKTKMVMRMKDIVRDLGYIERSEGAIDEMDVYERKINGRWGAKEGEHDDRVMVRMIAMIVSDEMPIPKIIDKKTVYKSREVLSEATI